MRLLLLSITAIAALTTPSLARADCGDPGAHPSIEGRSFAGTKRWNGEANSREAIVFNADCTVSTAEAREMISSTTWSQSGNEVTMIYNRHATYTGVFDGTNYSGTMRNPDLSGQFTFTPMPKADLRLWLWADLDQSCGRARITDSAAGANVTGRVEWADGASANLAFRLKPDCSGIAVDNIKTEVFWAQADGVVLIDVDDKAATYVGRWSDAGMSGKATRRDGVSGLFRLQRLDW